MILIYSKSNQIIPGKINKVHGRDICPHFARVCYFLQNYTCISIMPGCAPYDTKLTIKNFNIIMNIHM